MVLYINIFSLDYRILALLIEMQIKSLFVRSNRDRDSRRSSLGTCDAATVSMDEDPQPIDLHESCNDCQATID